MSAGGIETYLLRFLNFIQNQDIDITVIVRSNDPNGALLDAYKKLNVKIVFLPLGYFNFKRIVSYYTFFKSEKFDVICDFNANFSGLPMFLAWLVGVKKRITFYRQGKDHFQYNKFKALYNKFVNRLVYCFSTSILSNSNSALYFFFPYRKSKDVRFKVIRNGINIEKYSFQESKSEVRNELNIPEDVFVIGHVGRLDPAKNHATILKTVAALYPNNIDVRLLLCGKGVSTLKAQLNDLGIEKITYLHEHRDDIPRILKSVDCFFFPSLTEGQPNALIEAMASGIPFCASNILPIKESVPNELSELLKDPEDSQGFANIISDFMNKKNFIYQDLVLRYVEKEFNAEIRFNEFLNEIIK